MADRQQIGSHAALRGVAALLVVAYHLQFGDSHLAFEDATRIFSRGYLLVDLFFILSGFIISYVNRANRSEPVGSAEFRDFLGRRLIRLYPLLFFTLVYALLIAAVMTLATRTLGLSGRPDWSARSLTILASQAVMLNAWTTLPVGWNIPTWSISAELFAYALFPVLVSLHARRPRLALAVLAAVSIGFYAFVAIGSGSLDIVWFPAPFRCLAGFSLGMLIYYGRVQLAALRPAFLGAVQVVALALIVACLAVRVNDVLVIPAFAALVATTWTDRGIVARMLIAPPLLYLGEISYSIYLNHVPIIRTLAFVWHRVEPRLGLSHDAGRILWLVLCYAAVVIASHLTYRLVEIPARRILNRKLLGHSARPLSQSVPAP